MRAKSFSFQTALGSMALSLACIAVLLAPGAVLAQAKPTAKTQAAPAPAEPAPPPLKQIALTDKQIEDALAANAEITPITERLPEDAAPDPKIVAQLDGIAKAHGFASFADYDDVTANINLVMSGFDPETKQYVGQEVVLKKEIATVQADKKLPAKDKKQTLAELNAALKTAVPLQYQANVAVIGKYFDKLLAVMAPDKQ